MNPTLRASVRCALALLACAWISGCAGAPRAAQPTPDMAEVAGTYALVSVDAKPVPASISHDGAALEVRLGTFTLGADGRCSARTVFVPPSGREIAREVSAVYAKDGAQLTMWWTGAGTTAGSVEGDTFTMNNEGLLWVYNRERAPAASESK